MGDYILAGRISRTKGYKGELGLKMKLDDPSILQDLDSIFLEKNKKYIPYFLKQVKITPKGFANIFLDDVDGEMAEMLVGNDVYLPRELLEESEESSVLYQDIVGYNVEDKKHGPLGEITNVIEHPGNILMCIDGGYHEILIPMIDAFIIDIDHKKGLIKVDTPEGLIEVNQ
ncbi:MAG: 16S rRNA processing protein RimM [Patiriisocius sp.]|jgi:16S rRNA processing protein RimM